MTKSVFQPHRHAIDLLLSRASQPLTSVSILRLGLLILRNLKFSDAVILNILWEPPKGLLWRASAHWNKRADKVGVPPRYWRGGRGN